MPALKHIRSSYPLGYTILYCTLKCGTHLCTHVNAVRIAKQERKRHKLAFRTISLFNQFPSPVIQKETAHNFCKDHPSTIRKVSIRKRDLYPVRFAFLYRDFLFVLCIATCRASCTFYPMEEECVVFTLPPTKRIYM
ncbi:hypothetical protein POVWA2_012980 [Plasmodium ovale wallikeri]|uniref:Uncharacterized protein n=1 Tax=Plasmodium ovale wallikeri TaxID=864142 RepID=A0A1A8YNK8_PLAOA|nr:hypothetical protein POVWA2_012980 [Plasmodium ovale wallikeri]